MLLRVLSWAARGNPASCKFRNVGWICQQHRSKLSARPTRAPSSVKSTRVSKWVGRSEGEQSWTHIFLQQRKHNKQHVPSQDDTLIKIVSHLKPRPCPPGPAPSLAIQLKQRRENSFTEPDETTLSHFSQAKCSSRTHLLLKSLAPASGNTAVARLALHTNRFRPPCARARVLHKH